MLRCCCIAGALFATGCIDTDAAVFVEASIADPQAAVTMTSLAEAVSGGLAVDFHLGPRASGSSEVSLGALSITSADQTATLVEPLAAASSPPFPITVNVDSDVRAQLSFAAEDNLLEMGTVAELCAGPVVIKGAFDDGLRGATITAVSAPFNVSDCP